MAASMGMGREMIDWNKPIETVDGRAARLVETNIEKLQHIVYVYGKSDDVFLVDPEGYRCDDRAIYSKRQEPFIRNAPVKRVFETLRDRVPDPVEDAERAAHFETWKAKAK